MATPAAVASEASSSAATGPSGQHEVHGHVTPGPVGLHAVSDQVRMQLPYGGLQPPADFNVTDMVVAPFVPESYEPPFAKKARMTFSEMASLPTLDLNRSSLYLNANGCLAALDAQGAFHRIGLLNGRPVWKSQTFPMIGSPQRVSYLWFSGIKDGWVWSTNIPDENQAWAWNEIDMIGWINYDMTQVWIPWDADDDTCPVHVYPLQDYYAKRCSFLESTNLALHAEKEALKEVLEIKETGRSDPKAREALTKQGWKSKMVALTVAYEQGQWNKVQSLINKCFVLTIFVIPISYTKYV